MYMPAKVVAKGDSIHFFGYLTNQTKETQNAVYCRKEIQRSLSVNRH